jgi:hypothetical protein
MSRTVIALGVSAALLSLPVSAATPVGNSQNPAISLVMDGRMSNFGADPHDYELPGFQLGPETEPGAEGFAFHEAELIISGNVDERFYGLLTLAMHAHEGETEVELEEGWIQTLESWGGFTLKAGKLFSRIGYQNEKHPHAWDFADAALVYRAFLANNLKDAGVQVRWVAPTPFFLEVGAEFLRGDAYPAFDAADGGKGIRTAFVKLGGDLNDSHAWQVGLSRLAATAVGRENESHDPVAEPPVIFTGDSDLTAVDLVWKWAPDGNYKQRNFSFAAEYMRREEAGAVETDFGAGPELGTYAGQQSGYYAQAVYQFMPRWRIGARLDRLQSDNTVLGFTGTTVLDEDAHDPSRRSLMLDWSPSEFSRLRLQLNRDRSGPVTDTQVILQYIVSLGPHAAHQF